jgi:hypothetical protein
MRMKGIHYVVSCLVIVLAPRMLSAQAWWGC